ncbi:putative nucleotidyltransferase [Branchiibius hedensis]|uniref:Predicted nucleotidyltransferase n=1 Tax=Branchiibius hedensis TaxID=672460 RepID=A0A2Y8ZX12_9MICO|nr:nucleotidyltransferase domain-containing protein [Branchiibius hedensis]PWJ27027.1 putative nucleotidyltransferase [Branchiibius hedensis]SSA35838.1 Predicted nucleotidyltransferase [Branchiibius hedensis]
MSTKTSPNVSHGDRDVALANEILRVTVGSGAHGMAIEGHDDNDEMGVYVQHPAQLLGLSPTASHYVSRTQPEGSRSGPGDTDLVIYALRKFIRLAAAGNPTILIPFWSPSSDLLVSTPLGDELRSLRSQFATRQAGRRFLGYLDGQRDRLLGRGRQSRVPNRPELVAAHGYDTKYASHALRLGLQGIELITTGQLSLPLRSEDLEPCMEIKRGQVGYDEALRRIDDVRSRLAELLDGQVAVRDEPDMDVVNNWMVHAHRRHWDW